MDKDRQLKTCFNAKLGENRGEMVTDGCFGDTQAFPDLLVLEPRTDERGYLALAFGKCGDLGCLRIGRSRCPRYQLVDYIYQHGAFDPYIAGVNSLYRLE